MSKYSANPKPYAPPPIPGLAPLPKPQWGSPRLPTEFPMSNGSVFRPGSPGHFSHGHLGEDAKWHAPHLIAARANDVDGQPLAPTQATPQTRTADPVAATMIAAQAVAAQVLAGCVQFVSADVTTGANIEMPTAATFDQITDPQERQSAGFRVALLACIGAAAATRVTGKACQPTDAERKMLDYVLRATPHDADTVDAQLRRARSFIDKHWQAIQRIAGKIETGATVTSGQVRAALGATVGIKPLVNMETGEEGTTPVFTKGFAPISPSLWHPSSAARASYEAARAVAGVRGGADIRAVSIHPSNGGNARYNDAGTTHYAPTPRPGSAPIDRVSLERRVVEEMTAIICERGVSGHLVSAGGVSDDPRVRGLLDQLSSDWGERSRLAQRLFAQATETARREAPTIQRTADALHEHGSLDARGIRQIVGNRRG